MQMFEVIDENGKLMLKIKGIVPQEEKFLLTAAQVIRTLTLMGHQKSIIPLDAVFYQYNTLVYLRDGLHKYKEYIKASKGSNVTMEDRLYHRRFLQTLAALGSKIPDAVDEMNIFALGDLIGLLEKQYKNTFDVADELFSKQKTSHKSLFRLFKPGDLVVGSSPNLPNVQIGYRVTVGRYEAQKSLFGVNSSFNLGLEFIASLGEQFVLLEFEEVFSTHDVSKEVFVKDLHLRPATDEETKELNSSGEKYSRLINGMNFLGYSHKSFFPLKTFSGAQNGQLWSNKNRSQGAVSGGGRIMIDALKGLDMGYSISTGIVSIDAAIRIGFSRLQAKSRENKAKDTNGFPASDDLMLISEVPPSYYKFCLPCAVGFSFTTKCWGQVLINECEPVKFNSDAYDMLVLPEERKEMIKALITNHSKTSFNSVIQGKGEGAIFLFHGASGTGKTLTCEAIAELLHRPLYVVSVGELGTTPHELENNLQAILNLCESWQALILLDEADVFVEKRSKGEILRNSMVGVILRLTEYFRGVIFFTSNRITSFDPAFQSRVTVAMKYKPLEAEDRKKIWKTLLGMSGTTEDSMKMLDLEKVSKVDLNGRQIKNTIQLALALSAHRNQPITQAVLDSTINICLDFQADLSSQVEDKY